MAGSRGRALRRAGIVVVLVGALLAAPGETARETPPSDHVHRLSADAFRTDELFVAKGKPDPSGRSGAGGRAVAHYPGGKRVTSAKAVRRAPHARLFRTGYEAWEPTMGVTKRGGVFFNAVLPPAGEQIVRSTDGGKTWETVFDGHLVTADPYMYVDPDTSRVFANDLVPPCHLISFSDDNGDTWTTAPPAGCGVNQDHQTVFAGPPPDGGIPPVGYRNVVYLCSIGLGISVASAGSVCSKSLDGGLSWVPTGEPAFYNDPRRQGEAGIPGFCTGANAHGFVGPDGTVYLPRGWCDQPWLAMSSDEGTTWTRVQVADNGMACCGEVEEGVALHSHESGVVADARGNVYYTWVARDRLPYLAISLDHGETWSKPIMIGPPGIKETLLPGIDIGASGKIAVHYMGTTNSPWNGKEADGGYENTTWNSYVTITANALSKRPLFYTATINSPRDPLHVGACGPDPVRCSWGDFLDVVVDHTGGTWWVAVDLCDKHLNCDGFGEGIIGHLVGGPKLK